tara:strand:+ start:6980 stop:7576 length:597 start_codon:yes stop_codon:yes gene_type:complete
MKIVKVYGQLKKKLGQSSFELDVNTPAQAIKALCVNFPDLTNWFIDNDQNGYGYKVEIGKQKVYAEDLKPMLQPFAEKDILRIVPVIKGAGRGVGRFLLGVALVGVAFVAGPSSLALIGAGTSKALTYIGTSLILGGISQMLSPSPQPIPEASKLQSFSFSGIVNVADQGVPVPICYGRVFTGSVVVSFGLDSDPASP